MPRDELIREAGDSRDLRRDGLARLVELMKRYTERYDTPYRVIFEWRDGKFENLAVSDVEARALHIEEHANASTRTVGLFDMVAKP